MRLGGHFARAFEPVATHVGDLPVALIASPRLAQSHIGPRHVEDVVDDLEQDPELSGERTEGGQCSGADCVVREQQDALDRGADEPAGLQFVKAAQLGAALLDQPFDVDVLAAHPSARPRRPPPPDRPSPPDAPASSPPAWSTRAGSPPCWAITCRNASAYSASPARIAMSSP